MKIKTIETYIEIQNYIEEKGKNLIDELYKDILNDDIAHEDYIHCVALVKQAKKNKQELLEKLEVEETNAKIS